MSASGFLWLMNKPVLPHGDDVKDAGADAGGYRCVAALLTPCGEGGIGVIALAGADAGALIDRLFRNPRGRRAGDMRPGDLLYGVLERNGAALDEVLICRRALAPSPPVFEINCHGGVVAMQRVLTELRAEGAEVDQPGLETWGAPHALDMIQEEAYRLLPKAATATAAKMLLRQAEGALSAALRRCAEQAEAAANDCALDLAVLERPLAALLVTARSGRALCEPLRVVIAGKPNVGKSSLANALLAEERMLTHERPGTTRDWVEAPVAIGDYPMVLVDTAGIRVSDDALEAEGADRSRRQVALGDVILLVLDRSQPLDAADDELIANAELRRRPLVPVLNKADLLARVAPEAVATRLGRPPVEVSARTGAGLRELEKRILEAGIPGCEQLSAGATGAIIFTRRQEEAVARALANVQRARAAPRERSDWLRQAAQELHSCRGQQP